MNTSSIKEYIIKNQERKLIRAKFSNGEMFYFHDSRWINQVQFNKLYPVWNYLPNPNTIHNCDKSKVI
jgi:hypothetical protein